MTRILGESAKLRRNIDLGQEMTAWIVSEKVQEHLNRLFREAVDAELAKMMNGELLNVTEAATLFSMSEGAVRSAKRVGRELLKSCDLRNALPAPL